MKKASNMRHMLSKGKAKKLGVALFVVLIETASVLLDAFTNVWKPSLAGLCLSLVGFFIAIYSCCVKTTISKIKPLALKQLVIQEIALSVIQLIASITHLLAFLLHRKEIFDVSVFIPLSFAIVALAFAFYEEKKVIGWSSGDLSTQDFILGYDYWNSTPGENHLVEVKMVNDSNSTNTLRSRFRPRQLADEGPRIQNLQITGEARLGEKLFGHAELVNGTTSCAFQWIRESSPSGQRQRVEGATEQYYVVTVDDVDKLLALECIPVDDQGHQGEPVRVFANGNSEIQCEPDMKTEIERHIFNRKAIFDIEFLNTSTQRWEPAMLIVSWPSYEIKIRNTNAVVIRDHMFSEDAFSIGTRNGLSTQFILRCQGSTHLLSTYTVRMRDILVLTMREFRKQPSPVEEEASIHGYAFSPTEEEIVYFLELKVSGVTGRPEFDHIKEIELYEYEPSELPSIAYDSGHEQFYFFTLTRNQHGWFRRQTKGGYWRVLGGASVIKNGDGNPVASKRFLAHYKLGRNEASESVRTRWLMKEYVLKSQNNEQSSWALCVVYPRYKKGENLNL